MVITQRHWASHLIKTFCAVIVFMFSFGEAVFANDAEALRIETDVFADRDDIPIARSLTLFSSKVAWDFLDTKTAEKTSVSESDHSKAFNGEIVLHDPTRERVLLIDPLRQVKTSIDSIQLERLRVSLAKWAQTSDEIASQYRQFADTALLLRALLHPGGIPPFPRLAINKRIAAEAKLPTSVTLQIDSRGSLVTAGLSSMMQRHLNSVHRIHPALRADDLERIADAEACMAVAEEVTLAEYTQAEKR